MRLALAAGEAGRGRTSPNPVVGALVVRKGRVIARGFHARAGEPHAEVMALKKVGQAARGADLFVTLEPCVHFGRTPPCVDAIIAAGVRRVIIGTIDPNPLVKGRGVRRLRRAGIDVVSGVFETECRAANAAFFTFMQKGRARAVLKVAATLDGKIATASGDSRWVSGPDARALVHRWRDEFDAVLVGAETVRKDDPQLTTRRSGGKGRDAVRVMLDSRCTLPLTAGVFCLKSHAPTIVATTAAAPLGRRQALEKRGVEVIVCKTRSGRIDLEDLLVRLGARGLLDVLVEGGATVFGSFLAAGLVDELRIFVAPRVVGSSGLSWAAMAAPSTMADAMRFAPPSIQRIGDDVLFICLPIN